MSSVESIQICALMLEKVIAATLSTNLKFDFLMKTKTFRRLNKFEEI